MNKNQSVLLSFIRGKGHHYGTGITTYPYVGSQHKALHEDCLKLEKLGFVKRHFENNKMVVWKPLQEVD